ncbi:MAG: hypothetical protein K5839_05775 [Treponemataceae bacterium]|nr:hypothetical protein [Treponemataceae bacterium]
MKCISKKIISVLLVLLMLTASVFAKSKSDDSKTEEDQKKEKEKKDKNDRSFFDRYWESGTVIDLNLSNNYLGLSDILKETIVIDFSEMAESLSYKGLAFNTILDFRHYSNIYTKKLDFGFAIDFDTIINFALSKDTMALIANGNSVDEDMLLGAGFGAEAFVSLDLPFSFDIGEKLTIDLSASYFIPVLYIPYTDGTVTTRINSDGTLSLNGSVTAQVYSALPIASLVGGTGEFDVFSILAQGGVDLSFAGQYELLEFLDLGFNITNIPLVPSNLNCQYQYTATVDYDMDTAVLNQFMTNKSFDTEGFSYTLSENEAESSGAMKVFRPIKMGFWATWRILNNDLLALTPFMQFRLLDATVDNEAGFGFDYALTVSTDLKWFRGGFTTCYLDNIFKQQLDLAFNLRFFELDLTLSSQSANFLKSFCGTGFGLAIGIIFGF